MKLTDIVTEQQLDELDAGSIGRGIGAVGKAIGAAASVPQGIGRAIKKGYQSGVNTIGGSAAEPTAPAASASGGALSAFKAGLAGKTPGADAAASKETLAQITQLIGQLDPADVPAVSSLLQKKSAAPAANTPAPSQAAPKVAAAAPASSTPTKPAASSAVKSSPTSTAAKPQTPDQIRAAKQATAGVAAQAQMKANPAAPKPAATQTPDQIRAAKQAAATKVAQGQMAATPAAPASSTPTKPASSFNNQLAGGKQTVSTGSKFDPATMKNTPGTPVGDKVQGGVPAAGTQTTPAANTTQDGKPQWDPAAGKGAKYDGVTGEPTPAWKAEQDKNAASNTPGASAFGNMASQLTKGNDANYQSTLDKNVAAEKEKLAAMQEKNPKLAGMMAQAGIDDAGNDVPAGRTQGGGKVAGQLSQTPNAVKKREKRQQAADWDRLATGTESVDYSMNESRSIFTK